MIPDMVSLVLDALPDAYLIRNGAGTVVFANQAACRLFRQSAHDLCAANVLPWLTTQSLHVLERGDCWRVENLEIRLYPLSGGSPTGTALCYRHVPWLDQVFAYQDYVKLITQRIFGSIFWGSMAGVFERNDHHLAQSYDLIKESHIMAQLLRLWMKVDRRIAPGIQHVHVNNFLKTTNQSLVDRPDLDRVVRATDDDLWLDINPDLLRELCVLLADVLLTHGRWRAHATLTWRIHATLPRVTMSVVLQTDRSVTVPPFITDPIVHAIVRGMGGTYGWQSRTRIAVLWWTFRAVKH
jgi:hypothetical protein